MLENKIIKDMIEKEIKAVIFDLDGTLLDSMWVWTEIDRRFLGDRGFDVPADYLEAIAPLGARNAAEYTIERFGLNEQPEQLMEEWFGMAIEAYEKEVECKPNAIIYLNKLKKQGKKLAVATSSDRLLIIPALKRIGIHDIFDVIVTVDEVSRGKGFPDIYEKAARTMGMKNDECVVFEDILAGVKGAKMGEFMAVGVYDNNSDYEHPKMKEIADGFIMGFEELL